ncbi:MAG: hypothetical protein ABIJ96_13155 [Elusimicrobiota bacterium]
MSKNIHIFVGAAVTAFFIYTGAAFAAQPEPSFDQGIDVKQVVEQAREKAAKVELKSAGYRAAFDRTERDCATISLRADETRSERVMLESRFYQERCHPAGRHGERQCHEEWTHTERRSVRVEVVGRGAMLPWERDVFEVCLNGQWLNADVVDASHEYSIRQPGWNDDTVTATALRKTKSLPDPAGIYAQSLRVEDGNYVITYKDRWTEFYKGEQTVVAVQLKRHRSLWFDDTLVQKEISLPTSEEHAIRFADFAAEFKGKLKDGVEYYVKWRFKRPGSVSTDKWQGWWDTEKVKFSAGAQMLVTVPQFQPLGVQAQGRGACWFKTVEKDQCVYTCGDGSTYKQPVREPDPWNDTPTIPCPQLVIPF